METIIIGIEKVPIYLKDLFDYARSKGIEINDNEVIRKLWLEHDKEKLIKCNNCENGKIVYSKICTACAKEY